MYTWTTELTLILTKFLNKLIENAGPIVLAAAFFSLAWFFLFQGKKIKSGAMLILGSLIASFYGGFLSWINGLASDSFLEATAFDWSEALFWLKTFVGSLPYMLPQKKILFFILSVAVLLSVPFTLGLFRFRHAVSILVILILVVHGNLANSAVQRFYSGRNYINILKEAFSEKVVGMSGFQDVDLLVYIGESTSSMNMSLYGYPIKTTPKLDRLDKDEPGFIKFENIRSTHTHTSPSLIRALSLPSLAGNTEKRWGIGQILNQAGIDAHLISVQPMNGSFSTFSKFVFDGMQYRMHPENKYKGNFIALEKKDHELLSQVIGRPGVFFFHSYAGHGNYLDLIDADMSSRLAFPAISFEGLVGAGFTSLDQTMLNDMDDYNQAITYIDENVDRAIHDIKLRHKPAVLIYFSDHGDSVFTKRGHESSRYIDEMTTVPFVMYFNDAYVAKYPDVFGRYKAAAEKRSLKLLDQLVPTVMDILRVQSANPVPIPTMADAFSHPHPVIMERDTLKGASGLDFRYDDKIGFGQQKFYGGTPEPTLTSIINDRFKDEKTICYHRSDSYAKALRAARVASCLEFDLVVEGDKLSVYHPPAVATGFEIEHIFQIASYRKNKLWIDSKNLNQPLACNALKNYLQKNKSRVGEIFVEFPSESISRLDELRTCATAMRGMGIKTSYYVPTHWLLSCAENSEKNKIACNALHADVSAAMNSGLFTDLSFDFGGYPAIKKIDGARKFSWNTWTVKPQDFHKFPRQDFNYIIMDTSTDPNTY